jgi:hypothetical protein
MWNNPSRDGCVVMPKSHELLVPVAQLWMLQPRVRSLWRMIITVRNTGDALSSPQSWTPTRLLHFDISNISCRWQNSISYLNHESIVSKSPSRVVSRLRRRSTIESSIGIVFLRKIQREHRRTQWEMVGTITTSTWGNNSFVLSIGQNTWEYILEIRKNSFYALIITRGGEEKWEPN